MLLFSNSGFFLSHPVTVKRFENFHSDKILKIVELVNYVSFICKMLLILRLGHLLDVLQSCFSIFQIHNWTFILYNLPKSYKKYFKIVATRKSNFDDYSASKI